MPIRAALALLAALIACAALAAPAVAARPAGTNCDKGVDFGFTTAQVFVRNMTCVRGRQIVRKWRRDVESPAPRKTMVAGYACRRTGTDFLLTLRCAKGSKVTRARWGG